MPALKIGQRGAGCPRAVPDCEKTAKIGLFLHFFALQPFACSV
jgi:hypothetical protein